MGRSGKTVVVIGGINTDICGRPSAGLMMHDSNPGTVTTSSGGVGRNIAHNLALLGADVTLITALGGDVLSARLTEECALLGISMSHSLYVESASCPMYLYITDPSGDMAVAVNDMGLISRITPEYLAAKLDIINSADAVVIDANLSENSIEFIAQNSKVPVYADAVSAVKVGKLRPILGRLAGLKPNLLEAQMLTGQDSPAEAADALCAMGIKLVMLSLGSSGMLACANGRRLKVPAEKINVVNTTGAGDAAMAALVYADMLGFSLENTAKLAVKAGAATAACPLTNCPELADILKDF